MSNVRLATDLSPAWDEVVACAGEFKALGCKQVILTYVISVKTDIDTGGTLVVITDISIRVKGMVQAGGFT